MTIDELMTKPREEKEAIMAKNKRAIEMGKVLESYLKNVPQKNFEEVLLNCLDDFKEIHDLKTQIDEYGTDEQKEELKKCGNMPINNLDEIIEILTEIINKTLPHYYRVNENKVSNDLIIKPKKYNVKVDQLFNKGIVTVKNPKLRNHASCPNSLISEQLTKNHIPERIDSSDYDKNLIVSEDIQTGAGIISFNQKIDDRIDPLKDDSEILKNYKSIGFSREELQIYLALLNVYIQAVSKKDYGNPLEIETSFFHNEVLKRDGHLQKRDLERYRQIFRKIATKRICYSSNNASIHPYKKKEFRSVSIDSPLINIDIITKLDYKKQIINIVPSAYTLLELKLIKQISNYLPWDFLQLDFKESDNIFYFGMYLIRMHRNNMTSIIINEKGKTDRIKNVTFAWEIDFKKLVLESLPNGKELIEQYENEREKKKFIERNIEGPLNKAISFFEKCNYFIPQKNKEIILNYKKAFQENIIKIYFNYDNGKLMKLWFNLYFMYFEN